MSLKHILGLEAFPLTEEEVMRKIEDARRRNISEVVFSMPRKKVKVHLCTTNPSGLMTDWAEYYAQ